MAVNKFEDLMAWQKARVLTKAIYDITNVGAFAKDYGLRDQIRRAAVSVMSNIAEGFDREGDVEFLRFLTIAKASCSEVRSQLYIALDVGYLKQSQFDNAMEITNETGRVLNGLRAAIKRRL